MEPVRLPRVLAPVTHAERVKRAAARDRGDGSAGFKRYLRQGRDGPAHGASAAPEDTTAPADAVDPVETTPDGDPAPKRVIDVRV
jgi:hypothetical protein